MIPGSERCPGGGHGNPLQYSCLENPMDRGAWQATYSPWGCKELDTTEQLSTQLIKIIVSFLNNLMISVTRKHKYQKKCKVLHLENKLLSTRGTEIAEFHLPTVLS